MTPPPALPSGRRSNRGRLFGGLEAHIDAGLDDLIVEPAERLNITKTAFVTGAVREAALKVIARADVDYGSRGFDSMMASIDIADQSPELESLAALLCRNTT